MHRVSTFSSIISLRWSNLFLSELMFKYEQMILLWLWILRDFNSSNETFGCLWVFWHTLAKESDFYKEHINFLELNVKYNYCLVCSDEAYSYLNVINQCYYCQQKTNLYCYRNVESFSLVLAISPLTFSYSSISFTRLKFVFLKLLGCIHLQGHVKTISYSFKIFWKSRKVVNDNTERIDFFYNL